MLRHSIDNSMGTTFHPGMFSPKNEDARHAKNVLNAIVMMSAISAAAPTMMFDVIAA